MSDAAPNRRGLWSGIGPGIVVAATGVGAGDLVAAAAGGARFGATLLWAAALGALLKLALNEGLARWQLATGTTLLEGWRTRLPPWVSWCFVAYLVLWTFVVAGALMAACGLAAHALVPALPVTAWGVIHALAAAALALFGRYRLLEWCMKVFFALMFAVILACAVMTAPPLADILRGLLVPTVPPGSTLFVLGVVGGVGGSVTLLSYGYWMREKGWTGTRDLPRARLDLAVAYGLTGLFGAAVLITAAGVRPEALSGSRMALALADQLAAATGPIGKWLFLLGFWGAVFSSMLGVWQGVPYLFCDFVRTVRAGEAKPEAVSARDPVYRGYLAFIALPPMALLFLERPVWLVVIYAAFGALFMPFLAGALLAMNNRAAWIGRFKNGWKANLALTAALLLFAVLLWFELRARFGF